MSMALDRPPVNDPPIPEGFARGSFRLDTGAGFRETVIGLVRTRPGWVDYIPEDRPDGLRFRSFPDRRVSHVDFESDPEPSPDVLMSSVRRSRPARLLHDTFRPEAA